MRALLDVNVLISLFDAAHVFHARAHAFWSAAAQAGWASCPITENGVVRVMSHPSYSKERAFAPAEVIGALRTFAAGTDHAFWPDDVSFCDANVFAEDRIHGSRQQTDLYLLALAVRHGGRLVTFDRNIILGAVKAAEARHVEVI